MLDKAPLIDSIPELLVEGVGIRAVVTARYFDPPTIVLPSKDFGRGHQRATDTLAPVGLEHDDRCDACQVPRCVKKRKHMHSHKTHYAIRGLDCNQHGVG